MDDDFLDGIRFLNKKEDNKKSQKQKLMQAKISETKKIDKIVSRKCKSTTMHTQKSEGEKAHRDTTREYRVAPIIQSKT